ncbi:MAG TPA: J domain-containing protein [Mycobacteriales bacterium]|nr:J domain-containing protein [Mycobacteriales bacterium]
MNKERTDLYAILRISPQATQDQLRHAYRILLRQHHPDTRGTERDQDGTSTPAALQQVLAAYEVLRDPARRADYDRYRGGTARKNLSFHRRRADPLANSPIRAGPVRWHRQPGP